MLGTPKSLFIYGGKSLFHPSQRGNPFLEDSERHPRNIRNHPSAAQPPDMIHNVIAFAPLHSTPSLFFL
jgi:hypothetical protein